MGLFNHRNMSKASWEQCTVGDFLFFFEIDEKVSWDITLHKKMDPEKGGKVTDSRSRGYSYAANLQPTLQAFFFLLIKLRVASGVAIVSNKKKSTKRFWRWQVYKVKSRYVASWRMQQVCVVRGTCSFVLQRYSSWLRSNSCEWDGWGNTMVSVTSFVCQLLHKKWSKRRSDVQIWRQKRNKWTGPLSSFLWFLRAKRKGGRRD